MNTATLEMLACPFCGAPLELEDLHQRWSGDELVFGVLACACSAYPVIEGIPYVRSGGLTRELLALIGAGDQQAASVLALRQEGAGPDDVARALDESRPSFRTAASLLLDRSEADYLVYRFSDPTFIAGDAVAQAVLHGPAGPFARVLDVGGGAGHLTRSLTAVADTVLLADISFPKLWLASRHVAPASALVCCDANDPLPVRAAAFDMVYSSDAFHYVWSRRLLAGEMIRALRPRGVLVMTHLHNALVDHPSAGMPLTPDGYRHLFQDLPARIYGESVVRRAALAGQAPDFSVDPGAAVDAEAALVLLASHDPAAFSARQVVAPPREQLSVNPLYGLAGEGATWRIRYPSDGYAEEYADCRDYLPDAVDLPPDLLELAASEPEHDALAELRRRRVLLELPAGYC